MSTPSNSTLDEPAYRAAQRAAEKAKFMDLSHLPSTIDVDANSITECVHAMNSACPDERLKFILKNLVNHLHNFIRETSITSEEWMATINFLTATGQKCTDVRQEFILLSDILGASTLVDILNHSKPPGATESTVLGPFFTSDAADVPLGSSIASEGKGSYMFVQGRILDSKGNPIPGAVMDTWETDENGLYDIQYSTREAPDCRGRLRSDEQGRYWFRAVFPIPYPIPSDGPVGLMLDKLNRHVFRPGHLHMKITAEGFDELITALYFEGDQYLGSDAVFGVKKSLVVKPKLVEDTELTLQRGFKDAKSHQEVTYDFILLTSEEAKEAKAKAMPALDIKDL